MSQQQTCKRCGRDDLFNFQVNDETWVAVAKKYQNNVLCIPCFDFLARIAGHPYQLESLYFTSGQCLNVVTWEREATP